MSDLATRIEAAQPGQERAVLEALWLQIHHGGYPPEREDDDCPTCARFRAMLDAEAWLSAVEMLVPDGWLLVSLSDVSAEGRCGAVIGNPGLATDRYGYGATRALALAAAIARKIGHE